MTCRKKCPSETSSTVKPKWTVLGANSDVCGEKQSTINLSYGTAGCVGAGSQTALTHFDCVTAKVSSGTSWNGSSCLAFECTVTCTFCKKICLDDTR
jgi:hypothetical protein